MMIGVKGKQLCAGNPNADGQTDGRTDGRTDGLIESTTTLYRDREIHPSVKDLQSTTRLAESWKLHIFDTRVDFPVPVQSGG